MNAQLGADQGRVRIEGNGVNRTITLAPGASQPVDLDPGSYTVSMEALAGGTVVGWFERSNVSVIDGQQTTVSISPQAFSGPTPSAASQARAGDPFTVSWSPVTGAASYELQSSFSNTFSSILDQQTLSGTSASVTIPQAGTVFHRVRPVTRFNGFGGFGGPSTGTLVVPPVVRVDVVPGEAQVEVDQTVALAAVTYGPNDEVLTGRTVGWRSLDPGIASVDAGGVVTGRSPGTVDIVAESEGVEGMATVTVLDPDPASVTIDPVAATIAVNGTVDLTATVRTASGEVLTGFGLSWSSSDETVATVSATGRATGVGGGVATITATVVGFPSATGSATITVDAGEPPRVVAYDIQFTPVVQGCGSSTDFRTVESLLYSDADGNVNPAGPFIEPGGGVPTGIDSQLRDPTDPDWRDVSFTKTWSATAGSSGSSGGLTFDGATCFFRDDPQDYLDHRVRIRDANGNWSPWFEQRLHMPATVVVEPTGTQTVAAGASQQFSTTVRDATGNAVPGDPVNWSTYIGPTHASVTATGLYTVNPATPGGADRVAARAAFVSDEEGVIGGTFQADSWFSPGWNLGNIAITAGQTRTWRVKAYPERTYDFTLSDTPGSTATGNADLYVRFGQVPTLTTYDARSTTAGRNEAVSVTATSESTLWIMIHAQGGTDLSGVTLVVEGDRIPPQDQNVLTAPGPGRATEALDSIGGPPILLAPAPGSAPAATAPDSIPGGGRRP
ncbi:MAG: Ig-like domain-containing protein [Longimicrobiales bacterium]